MHQPETVVQRFMTGLQQMEEERNVNRLLPCFSDSVRLENRVSYRSEEGTKGAASFWQAYLSDFEQVQSHFHRVVAASDHAILEWTSKGQLASGTEIEYNGVSLLDIEGGQITGFRTYYDTARFVPARSPG